MNPIAAIVASSRSPVRAADAYRFSFAIVAYRVGARRW
jgi:hypothetical protein